MSDVHGARRNGPYPHPRRKLNPRLRALYLTTTKFAITDEEALYIREVTEEKTKDPTIQVTVQAHREDRVYLEGPFQGQVNGLIQAAYAERGRYDELGDAKYT